MEESIESKLLFCKAKALMQANPAKGIELLEKLRRMHPECPDILREMGLFYYKSGEYEKAFWKWLYLYVKSPASERMRYLIASWLQSMPIRMPLLKKMIENQAEKHGELGEQIEAMLLEIDLELEGVNSGLEGRARTGIDRSCRELGTAPSGSSEFAMKYLNLLNSIPTLPLLDILTSLAELYTCADAYELMERLVEKENLEILGCLEKKVCFFGSYKNKALLKTRQEKISIFGLCILKEGCMP